MITTLAHSIIDILISSGTLELINKEMHSDF